MMAARKFVFAILLLSLMILQGCNKKKAGVPPKMQAPTEAVQLPNEIPLTETPDEPTQQVAQTPPTPPPAKPKPKKTTRTANTTKKTPPPTTAATPPQQPAQQTNNNQTVASVRPPHSPESEVAPETTIAAAVPSAQVLHQKEDTARMVDATENALKGISRQLSDDEKSMRTQVQSFLQQSRKATVDGDFERAYNLAKKAQLLADALIKK